jgi:hypothetical protein
MGLARQQKRALPVGQGKDEEGEDQHGPAWPSAETPLE